jgi:hypothetical protein
VLTEVILGCAAVVTVPAVVALVAAPLNAPTKVVAVIEALAKLALMPVLITACELPLALDVLNVGYTVVAVEVFCSSAAALVAEVALSAAPAVATFKFATRVVDVTVNGAVPTAILEINRVPVIVPLAPNEVNVPTLVMLGCAFVVTVPAVVAALTVPVTLAPAIALSPLPLPVITPE